MRFSILTITAGLIVSAVPAQNARPSQRLDNATLVFDPAVDSDGDLTAVAYTGDNNVFVQVSDGAGLNWSAPVRVDGDTTGARKDIDNGRANVQVEGNNVYLLWNDRRNGGEDLYFVASNDGGATFGAEVLLTTAGNTDVADWRMIVSGSNVYVLYSAPASTQDILLRASTDGGATFGAATRVAAGFAAGAQDVDEIDLAANGNNVYCTWEDNRNAGGDTVFFQMSTDAGQTWLANDVNISGGAGEDADNAHRLSVSGSTVAIVWAEEPTGSGSEVLQASVSTDGGATFSPKTTVGGYTAGTDDVDFPWCYVAPNGNIVAAWEDNRSGSDQAYASVSTDGGATWSTDAQLSTSGAGFPRIVGGGDVVVVTWTGGGFPESAFAAISEDAGVSFGTATDVSDTTGDADFAEGAYNTLYDNFISVWASDDLGSNNFYVAGTRVASVVNNGWGTNDPTVSFDVSGFGTDPVVFILLSGGTGPLVLPGDPRNLGLTADGLLLGALASPIFTAFPTAGSGSTPVAPNVLAGLPPIGTTVNFIGLGVSTTPGMIGRLTDAGSFDI